ncbi:MAG: hypothetical protein ABIK81_04155 [candidate division WOR-3 bacterium]
MSLNFIHWPRIMVGRTTKERKKERTSFSPPFPDILTRELCLG